MDQPEELSVSKPQFELFLLFKNKVKQLLSRKNIFGLFLIAIALSLPLFILAANGRTNIQQHASSCGVQGTQCLTQPCCSGYTCNTDPGGIATKSANLGYYCHLQATQSATLTPTQPIATPSATPRATPTPAPISYTCQNIYGQSCLNTRLGTSCTNTDPSLTTGSGTCPINNRCCKKLPLTPTPTPTPKPYSACTGKKYVGGICGKDGKLYSCNGAGGTNSVVACAYGCQANSGTYDTCRCPYSCISSRICNNANDLRTFPVTGSCSSGSVCCKSL